MSRIDIMGDIIALLCVFAVGALLIVGGAALGMNHYQRMQVAEAQQ